MAEINQFGSVSPSPGFGPDCQRCERELIDALDGTLSPEDQARFDAHLASCAECQEMLADARRGVAWLEMLRTHRPEPPSDLVDRILTRTAGIAAVTQALPTPAAAFDPSLVQPAFAGQTASVLPFVGRPERSRPSISALLQTRFAMTAAMAFFSVALTLNLLGLHLSDLHSRDLRPSSLRRDASDLNARVFRYYESLRVVYELESRVRDLQRSGDSDPSPQSQPAAEPTPSPTTQAAPNEKAPSSPDSNSSPSATGSHAPSHNHSTNEAHPHDAAPVGALPHAAPGATLRLLPASPTPGLATPVAFPIVCPHGQKGLRA